MAKHRRGGLFREPRQQSNHANLFVHLQILSELTHKILNMANISISSLLALLLPLARVILGRVILDDVPPGTDPVNIGPEDVFFFDTPVCTGVVSQTYCHKCVEPDGSDSVDPIPFGLGLDFDATNAPYWGCYCKDPDGSQHDCLIYKLSDEDVSLLVDQYGALAGVNLLQMLPLPIRLPPELME